MACASPEPGSPALRWVLCANPAPSWVPARPLLVPVLLDGEDDAVGKACVGQAVAQLGVSPHMMPMGMGIADPGWCVALRDGSNTPPKPAVRSQAGTHVFAEGISH